MRNHSPHVVVMHPGGLGDLVLLSELIASLKTAHPEGRVTLLCREEFTSIVDCYAVPPDALVGLPFQPYDFAERGDELAALLPPIMARFNGRPVTLIVDAALRPSRLSESLAAALHPGDAVRCGPGSVPQYRNIEIPGETHERERYRMLAEALEITPVRAFPWSLLGASKESAVDWLRGRGLAPGKFLVCAPFGAASTPVKRWPMESFNEALHRFFRESQWPVLLMGDSGEDEGLSRLELLLFDVPTSRFAGRPEDLPLAAAILSMAGAYLSNDSGLMHLAQAFEVPGAAIYGGGGEWPAYAPWARGSAGLCHPLPCFGCAWDCFLGHGLCVESIPVAKVCEALSEVSRAPGQSPRSVIVETVSEPLLGLVADANARYREAQQDRSSRQEVIVELDRARRSWVGRERELLDRLAETERAAAERLSLLEEVHVEASRRLDMIHQVTAEAEARGQTAERLAAALGRSEASRLELERALPPKEQREGSHWIATGADAEYFASARLLIASWWEHNRSLPFFFCDFGLTPEQREEASAWPVIVAPAPTALAGAPPRRAKAGLAQYLDAAGVQWKSVTWVDADAVMLRPLPSLDEIADGYDLVCDVSPLPIAANFTAPGLDPSDAYFESGFWTATSRRLIAAVDRMAESLPAGSRFREADALTAAIYATKARVRTTCGGIWHVRGAALDAVAVDGDWVGYAGQQAYVLHANRRFVVAENGQRILNRDVLRAVQARFEERYRVMLIEWQEKARAAAL